MIKLVMSASGACNNEIPPAAAFELLGLDYTSLVSSFNGDKNSLHYIQTYSKPTNQTESSTSD